MNFTNFTIEELQRFAEHGTEGALEALGRRAMTLTVTGDEIESPCQVELEQLRAQIEDEIPEECPHCGEYLDWD